MATLSQANRARELHADDLRKRGAHGLAVEDGKRYRKTGHVVVAFVNSGTTLPKTLEVKPVGRGKTIEVPLVTVTAERFKVSL
jgi:hypothetical protein